MRILPRAHLICCSVGITLALLLFAAPAFSQERGISNCKLRAARELRIGGSDIEASWGADAGRGTRLVNWTARGGGRLGASGVCTVNTRNGDVINFEIRNQGPGGQPGGGYGGGGYGGGDVRTIKCESENNRRRYCGQFPGQFVSIRERISDAECIEGRSWGTDGGRLWVDRGCRAIFSVGRYSRSDNSDRGWWERDANRDRNDWPPRGDWHGKNWDSGGACFYRDDNFGGNYFCMRRGEEREGLAGYGDQITSIRVFGSARVVVFDNMDFRGTRQVISNDVTNLRNVRHGNRNWNNRISSIRVE